MKKPVDPVVIRVWREKDGDVFALFPALPADNDGYLCDSFQHLGGHGAANYGICIDKSRPANAAQIAEMVADLRKIGYNPKVYQRQTPAMRKARRGLATNPEWCSA